MVPKWWLYEQSEAQNLVQWRAIHLTWKILTSTKNWCMVCTVPQVLGPIFYKTTVDCAVQTSHPSSSWCSQKMKSLLASSRQLHVSYLSKKNGFIEREFWQAIHFYRFVAPPYHQTGYQFLSLRLTKRDKTRQTHTRKTNLGPTSNLKLLSLQMYCYIVSKNINQRVQEATFNTHCDHERWHCKFFPPPFIVKCTDCVKYVLYY